MNKYYSLKSILQYDADYNMVIGQRSNGKTYQVKRYGFSKFVQTGEQMALVRRFEEDFKAKRGAQMFADIVEQGIVEKETKGKWNNITYRSGMWFLSKFDEKLDKMVLDEKPFCYGFGIGSQEHDKSTSYPNITTILFDEFISRGYYLPDEFVLFMNVVSTIVRDRTNVKIFMLGNTINKYCPYFEEMGITNITTMKQGTIDVYTYGNSSLKVAVEFSDVVKATKKSNKYFAFNNPKLNMITSGVWELDIYPHLPYKYKQKDILSTYFVIFNGTILQCEIIGVNGDYFTYIHRKTSDLQYKQYDLIFSTEVLPDFNHSRRIDKPRNQYEDKIYWFIKNEKVFYQSNEIGEVFRNYLIWCKKNASAL